MCGQIETEKKNNGLKIGFVPAQQVVTLRVCRPMHRAFKALGIKMYQDGIIEDASMQKALTIVLHQFIVDHPEMLDAYNQQREGEHHLFPQKCLKCCNDPPSSTETCKDSEASIA